MVCGSWYRMCVCKGACKVCSSLGMLQVENEKVEKI